MADLRDLIRMRPIFDAVVDLPAEQQAAALAQACGADHALRAAVEELLALDGRDNHLQPDDLALAMNSLFEEEGLLQRGERIGNYTVVDKLGSGGMAEVWEVQHSLLGTRHALKVLTWGSSAARERLLAEGRAQARLEHRNLVPIRDVLQVNGAPALLMPLIAGPSLAIFLRHHTLPAAEATAMLRELLAGAACIHRSGLVHRDIKPANILLDIRNQQLVPRIADFGIVQQADARSTRQGIFMGTPGYASPEQHHNAAGVDARSDLYSLGVVLVVMLTGGLPKPDASGRPFLDGLPGPLRAVAATLLEPDPARRPDSAGEVLGMLDAVSAEPLSAYPWLTHEAVALGRSVAPPQKPPSAPVRSREGNLPTTRDRFIGRQEEQQRLRALLTGSQRLITVTGPGGVGKTRLSIETCQGLKDAFTGGIWWIDLSEDRDEHALLSRISQALREPLRGQSRSELLQMIARLGSCLLLIDNFEQLIEHAPLLGQIIDHAPQARVLVTSRERLSLRGEQLVVLAPMPPDEGRALFIDRARAVQITIPPAAPDLDALLTALDGLPLAIELAAARTRLMSLGQMVARIHDRFRLLQSRSPDLSPRQRTLEATLEWSWGLLRPAERTALAQASVFEGGLTLAAAEAVIDLSALPEQPWIEDVVAELIDKSLLHHSTAGRLGMLLSVQDFARRQLGDSVPVRRRHAAFFARWIQRDSPALKALLPELDNLIVGAAGGDSEDASTCAHQASFVLSRRGPPIRAVHLLRQTRAAHAFSPELECYLLNAEGCVLLNLGQHETAPFEQALALARSLQDTRQSGYILNNLGVCATQEGRYEDALACFQEALQLKRAAQGGAPDASSMRTLSSIGEIKFYLGHPEAEAILQQALVYFREKGLLTDEGVALERLGQVASDRGDHRQAREHVEEAVRLLQGSQDLHGRLFFALRLSGVLIRGGDIPEAEARLGEVEALKDRLSHFGYEGSWLRLRGQCAAAKGDLEAARALLTRSVALLAKTWQPRELAEARAALEALSGSPEGSP